MEETTVEKENNKVWVTLLHMTELKGMDITIDLYVTKDKPDFKETVEYFNDLLRNSDSVINELSSDVEKKVDNENIELYVFNGIPDMFVQIMMSRSDMR